MLEEIHVLLYGLIPLSTTMVFDEDAVEQERRPASLHVDIMQNLQCSARQGMDGHGVSIGKPQLYGCLELGSRCGELVDGTT